MRFKKLAVGIAVVSLFSTVAQADILMRSSASNACSKLPGHWIGDGTVQALSGLVNCRYHGDGKIEKGDTSDNFVMHIKLTTDSPVCPTSEIIDFDGSCSDGKIILHTNLANLSGSIDASGTSANVAGDVTFEVDMPWGGKQKVKATVNDMKLNKTQ